MKFIINGIDRFCHRHRNFGIPNLMLFLVIGNIIVYLFSMMDSTGLFLPYLYLEPSRIIRGEIWRLVTFLFIPTSSNLLFYALILYFYYFIGNTLEKTWGSGKFTIYYLSGVVFLILYAFIVYLATGTDMRNIDGYYLNLSMFFAFATLYPDQRVLLFFFIPIKIKWLAYIDALYFLYAFLVSPFPYNFISLVVVLNYLVFCGDYLVVSLRTYAARHSRRVINFKHEKQKIERQQKNSATERKCAVCGRSAADYPNLEFRYCSRCQGYHCFCEDHINNHVHFTE